MLSSISRSRETSAIAAGRVGAHREAPSPLPMNSSLNLSLRSSTVGAPITIGAPQADMSPMRAAGRPPISTVVQPGGAIGVTPCGPAGGGIVQRVGLPTTAAGMPPMRTVGHAGRQRSRPGCPVGSPTRAAGGIAPCLS